jgi:hypothetical protein
MPEPIVAYWEALPAWITLGLAVLAALLLALAIWWLWWRWPKLEAARLTLKIRDAKARADVEDNFWKTVSQALGSVVVLLGTGVALLGAVVAYLQLSQQQRASHDLLISNQVAKGFELLGNKQIVVRLGGIYALEGVMNNSDQYPQPVLEALTAFVRNGKRDNATSLPTDIQAALTVIGRRSDGPGIVDLTKADIADAKLGIANLTRADLEDANLTGAFLSGADLGGTILISAHLAHADLTGAKLRNTDLGGANLTDTYLIGANIDQKQLDEACGSDAKLPPGLTLKPCPPHSPP